MDTFAADARVAPATSHGAAPAAYEELCLNNPNFLKKGPYVRQSAWWSFVQAAMNYDTMFSAWRYTLREVGKRLIQSGADLKALEKEALQQLHTTMGAPDGGNQPAPRELHQKQLRAVRAAKGNQILLAPMLMHNLNVFNMRVILLASHPFGRGRLSGQLRRLQQPRELSSRLLPQVAKLRPSCERPSV